MLDPFVTQATSFIKQTELQSTENDQLEFVFILIEILLCVSVPGFASLSELFIHIYLSFLCVGKILLMLKQR